jgi:DNA-binding transcriptional ArsR family regulator
MTQAASSAAQRQRARTLQALAAPPRQRILDLLRQHGPMTAGAIADHFPRISRPAVSKHLALLRQADLVRAERRGRQRWYRLNAAPLGRLYRDWLALFEDLWLQRLTDLKQTIEKQT